MSQYLSTLGYSITLGYRQQLFEPCDKTAIKILKNGTPEIINTIVLKMEVLFYDAAGLANIVGPYQTAP